MSGLGQGRGFGIGGSWQGIVYDMSGPEEGIGYGKGGSWQRIINGMSGPGQGIGLVWVSLGREKFMIWVGLARV